MTNKLTNAEQSSKAYWSILKSFLNKKRYPLFLRYFMKTIITNFKEKAELFNSFLLTNAQIMSSASKLRSTFALYTDSRLSTVTFSQDILVKF